MTLTTCGYVDERYADVGCAVVTGPLVGGYSVVNSMMALSDVESCDVGHDLVVACLDVSSPRHLATMLGWPVYCGSPDNSSGDGKDDVLSSESSLTEKYADVITLLAPTRYITID